MTLALLASGCFSSEFRDGQVACSVEGICPPGFACVDGLCRSDNTPPADARQNDAMNADAAVDAEPQEVRLRSNVNGPEVDGVDFPGTWAADPGAGGVCNGTEGGGNGTAIQGTVDDDLFNGNMRADPLLCTLGSDLPPGDYDVTLLFAETFFGGNCTGGGAGVGARVFDVIIEGDIVETDLDPFVEGNGCVADAADADAAPFARTYSVTVDDGDVDIRLSPSVGSAVVSAIAVVSEP